MDIKNKGFLVMLLAFVFILNGCSFNEPKNTEKDGTVMSETTGTNAINTSAGLTVNEKIHINQIGYRPKDKKIFAVNGKDGKFEVVNDKDGKVVLKGSASGKITDAASGDTLYYGDFSSLDKPGRYFISMPGFGKSYPFTIDSNVYKDVKNAMLKAFYFQRCGIELEEKYAGQWKHNACHLSKGYIYGTKDKMLEANGGWHDAGDYGKYTVPAAKAVADLLLAYEFFPGSFKESINIPESGNGVPDIINEVRYELDWLLKMQDTQTGGVYHKLTTSNFPGIEVMPEVDIGDLFFSPVSSTATADFAAVTAMASRVYKPFDSSFSEKCLQASEKAWKWLVNNKGYKGFKNPSDISTGEYKDGYDGDEKFWAAAELFRVTGKDEYHAYVKAECKNEVLTMGDFGWADCSAYGAVAYLLSGEDKADGGIYSIIKSKFLASADKAVVKSRWDGYNVPLGTDNYIWGSNMLVLNAAQLLIIANMFGPNPDYIYYANEYLNYIMGRNALDQCYLTGFGSKPARNPHHRPSVGDGVKEPVPGLVIGGPDSALEDSVAQASLKNTAPARCYIDDILSCSTNEITIYWNSPGVFVAGYFDQD